MKNTRTFTDLDLNFTPAPSSQDRYVGTGTISFTNLNSIVSGINAIFLTFLEVNNNLYVDNVFLGKIKTIISDSSLELYGVVSLSSEINKAFTYSLPADISVKTDANAIKASLKHLILTMNYERHFNSKVGSQVNAIMFEPASPMTEILLRRSIEDTITSFEPRVIILDIVINMDKENHTANISIYFQIVNTTQPLRIDLVLERTR
jgi:phage baseplate assembly protein W